jgi:ribokinase
LIGACDYLIVNESEASYLTGKSVEKLGLDAASEIGRQLISKGANKVVVTLAENGSLYIDHDNEIYTPAFKINAVDTTAAGDAFCGAFATAISDGKPISYCLKFASAAGALAATKAGAVPSLPNSNEILSMLASVQ